jgi:hypothetical protein
MLGGGVGLSASPLITQALVHVPMPRAADASGLLTTAIQLGQLVGVAALGTVFLAIRFGHNAPHPADQVSAAAMQTTAYWLASVSVLGAGTAAMLARAVLPARPPDARQEVAVPDRRMHLP